MPNPVTALIADSRNTDKRNSNPSIPMAVYARYSSDMQRHTSIEDQLRNCREACPKLNAYILEDWIRSDEAKSGKKIKGRIGLEELRQVALSGKAPFRGILIDDTSRLGRKVSKTLHLIEELHHANIFVYFVTQQLDSRSPTFAQFYPFYAMVDEQYSVGVGKKVHRGQRGRVLDGCIPQGRVYGYNNVAVEDPRRKGKGGRPLITEVRLEIDEKESDVLLRMFKMTATGMGTESIAKALDEDGVPSTCSDLGGKHTRWQGQTIKRMLNNTKYRGLHIWNKTTYVINPNTEQTERRDRPESEWEKVAVPEWRIVSDELWDAAHAARETCRKKYSGRRLGGLSRTEKSRGYIYSGLLTCGLCGGNLVIIENRPNCTRYICSRSLKRGCSDRRSIHRETLQTRLTEVLKRVVNSNLHTQLTGAILESERVRVKRTLSQPDRVLLDSELLRIDKALNLLAEAMLSAGHCVPYQERIRLLNLERAKGRDFRDEAERKDFLT